MSSMIAELVSRSGRVENAGRGTSQTAGGALVLDEPWLVGVPICDDGKKFGEEGAEEDGDDLDGEDELGDEEGEDDDGEDFDDEDDIEADGDEIFGDDDDDDVAGDDEDDEENDF